MKIRGIQGFYFDRPMDVLEFEKRYILTETDADGNAPIQPG